MLDIICCPFVVLLPYPIRHCSIFLKHSSNQNLDTYGTLFFLLLELAPGKDNDSEWLEFPSHPLKRPLRPYWPYIIKISQTVCLHENFHTLRVANTVIQGSVVCSPLRLNLPSPANTLQLLPLLLNKITSIIKKITSTKPYEATTRVTSHKRHKHC
jgi:hypothetical protein